MSRRLAVFYPGGSFPALSITGDQCQLQCDHCQGRFLRSMVPVRTPEALLRTAHEIEDGGAVGFLLSGGCDPQGRIPLGPFVEAISEIKRSTHLKVNLHTGLLDKELAYRLVETGVDVFSIDIVQDEEVITNVFHLATGKEKYHETLDALELAGAKSIVPHICVGLGSEAGEIRSLELISKFMPSAMIVLVLMKGPMFSGGGTSTMIENRVVDIVSRSSNMLSCPTLLGCMRPRGRWELEVACIKAGAQGVVSPSSRTLEWAKGSGYDIAVERTCCSLYL